MAGKCDHCHQYAETTFTYDTVKPYGDPSVWQKKGIIVYSLCEHCAAELCDKLEKVHDECKRTGEPYAEKSADVVLDYIKDRGIELRRCLQERPT